MRVLNLNAPNLPLDEVKGAREAELAAHGEVWIASADVSGGDLKIEFAGLGEASPGTDVALLRDGYVAVTPLISVSRAIVRDVRGAAETLEAVRAWERILPEQSKTLGKPSGEPLVPTLDASVTASDTRRRAMT